MPYSNIQGATPNSLVSIAVYLANTEHEHHKDYELTPVQVLGAASVQEFISFARESFKANRQKMKAGRPPENAANWFIVRTPEDTHLEPQEMAAYEQAAREVAGMGAPVVGIMNWHRNSYTGASDLNLLSAAFAADGKLLRDRQSHPVKTLRWRMDQVTHGLNAIRKSRGLPLITTMQEVKKERAQQRGETDLVEQLARLPRRPIRAEDLEPALISLGCQITRFNLDGDTISVKAPKKEKPKRITLKSPTKLKAAKRKKAPSEKAKRFRISTLLEQVDAIFQGIAKPEKSPETPVKVPTPYPSEKPEIKPSSGAERAIPQTPTLSEPKKSDPSVSKTPIPKREPKTKQPEEPSGPEGPN